MKFCVSFSFLSLPLCALSAFSITAAGAPKALFFFLANMWSTSIGREVLWQLGLEVEMMEKSF